MCLADRGLATRRTETRKCPVAKKTDKHLAHDLPIVSSFTMFDGFQDHYE